MTTGKEDIIILYICAPDNIALKGLKTKINITETDKSIILQENVNLSKLYKKQTKISKIKRN